MNENTHSQHHLLHHKRIAGSVVLVLILLALFLFVKSVGEIKAYRFIGGGVPISNSITVSGQGEIFAVPDIATFTFSVVEEAKTVKEAQDEATRKINSALELLEMKGIEERDIKTTSYNLYPRYEFVRSGVSSIKYPNGRRELTGYEVNQSITVKVRDTEKAGEILADIGAAGVSNVSGLQFTIDDEEELQREARKEAIEKAKEKAKELANDLGVSLVRVVNFSESGAGTRPVFRAFDTAIALESSVGGSAPEIPVGENKIVSNVNITYEIR